MSDTLVATPPRRRGHRYAARRGDLFHVPCDRCARLIEWNGRGGMPKFCNDCRRVIHYASPGPRFRRRGELFTDQRRVLDVLTLEPVTATALVEALGIEWPTVRHNLDQLTRRRLAVEIPGRPTTWRRA